MTTEMVAPTDGRPATTAPAPPARKQQEPLPLLVLPAGRAHLLRPLPAADLHRRSTSASPAGRCSTQFIGLDNFVAFFQEPALVKGLTNTLIYAVVTSGLKVVLGMLLAVLLTSQIIGRGFLRSVVFFPVLVSTIGVGLMFTVLMNPERGLINDALGVCSASTARVAHRPESALFSVALVDVWKGVGLATVIYIAGIVSIPREYFEAAEVDGAGPSQLPAHRPAAGPPGHHHGDHPVADRRPALVRPDLGDDPRRPGIQLRRHRVGHLQAVPGRLLRAVDRGQRGAVPAGHRDHPAAVLVAQPREVDL